MSIAMRHSGVFCCSRKSGCKWQCLVLHHGLGWGTIPNKHNAWRRWHDQECSGVLIQLCAPADGANNVSGVDVYGNQVMEVV